MLSHNFLTSLIVKIIERQNPANNQPTKKEKSRKYFTIKKALIRWIIRSSDAHNHVFWHEKSAEGWGKGLHLFFVFFYPPLCVHLLSMGLFIHSAHNCISLSMLWRQSGQCHRNTEIFWCCFWVSSQLNGMHGTILMLILISKSAVQTFLEKFHGTSLKRIRTINYDKHFYRSSV